MHKGTTTAKRFNNASVLVGWYQACLSRMISKVILKIYSGTVPHVMRQYAWYTSHNLEASHSLHTSEMVKSGIDEYNTSYDETVEVLEEIIVTHPSYLICYDETRFQLTQKVTRTNKTFESTLSASKGDKGEVL